MLIEDRFPEGGHDGAAAMLLADGTIVDELREPDRDAILDKMTGLQDIAARKAAG